MKKSRKIRVSYGFALVGMAATLSALQAYADDYTSPVSDMRPPQIAPAANQAVAPAPQPKVLGTLNGTDLADTLPAAAPHATVPPAMAPSSSVPLVQPLPVSSDGALQPQQAGDVTYMTGGIGDEERSTLAAAKKDYNLHVMSANKDGSFVGDTHIVIRGPKDTTLLDTTAGPLFYAKLPAGTYTVEVSKNGQVQKHKITVGAKAASDVHMSW